MANSAKNFKLLSDDLLHITVEDDGFTIIVSRGTLNVFGMPIPLNRSLPLRRGQHCFHAVTETRFQLSGNFVQIEGFTPIREHMKLHAELEKLRQNSARGPRVLIVGPTDSGKSTLCQTLLNYAVRDNRKPAFLDLDPGQSAFFPGTLSAALVSEMTIDKDFVEYENPLMYFYGFTAPSKALPLYKRKIRSLANGVESSCSNACDGIIVNTPGWVDGNDAIETIGFMINALDINVVVVLKDDKLVPIISTYLHSIDQTIIHIPSPTTITARSAELRSQYRDSIIHKYFFGPNDEFHPFEAPRIPFREFTIFRLDQTEKPKSPPGFPSPDPQLVSKRKKLGDRMKSSILAISSAKHSSEIFDANVTGFIHIRNMDFESKDKVVNCFLPYPDLSLKDKFLIYGNIKWKSGVLPCQNEDAFSLFA